MNLDFQFWIFPLIFWISNFLVVFALRSVHAEMQPLAAAAEAKKVGTDMDSEDR